MEYPTPQNSLNFDKAWVKQVLEFIDTEDVSYLQVRLKQNLQWYLWREDNYSRKSFLDIALQKGKAEAVRTMFCMCDPRVLLSYGISCDYYSNPIYVERAVENAAEKSDAKMVSELITIGFPFNTSRVFNQYSDVIKQAYQIAFEKQNKQFVSNMFDILLSLPLDILRKYIDTAMEWTQWQDIRNLNFLLKSIYSDRRDIVEYIFNLYEEKYWPHLIHQTLGVNHKHILQRTAQNNIYLFIELVKYGCNAEELINNENWMNYFSAVCQQAIEYDDKYVFCNVYPYADLSKLDLSKATGKIAELIEKCVTPDRPSPLQIAIEEDNSRLLISLVHHGYDTSLYPTIFNFICEYAIEIDDIKMFAEFIGQATLSKNQLERAKGDIQKFLNYRPQKRKQQFPTIKEHLFDEKLKQDLPKLKYDEAHSSDEESSDSDVEEIKWINDENNLPTSLNHSEWLFRGVHFSKKYFATVDRKNALKKSYHTQPVSLATSYLQQESMMAFDKADETVKQHLLRLKSNSQNTSYYSPTKKVFYDCRYHELIQEYVNAYETLLGMDSEKGQRIKKNYGFPFVYNPFISTFNFSYYGKKLSDNIKKYVLGDVIEAEQRFYPKRRWSTGIFKHRRLGYIEVYAIDKNSEGYIDVGRWKKEEKIKVKARRELGEVILESSVPAKCVLGYVVIAIPSFSKKWSSDIQRVYGLNQYVYNSYQRSLLSEKPKRHDDPLTTEIVKKVVEHQINYFIERIVNRLERIKSNQIQTDELMQRMSAMRLSSPKSSETSSSSSTLTKQANSTQPRLLSTPETAPKSVTLFQPQRSSSSTPDAINGKQINPDDSQINQLHLSPK